MFKVKIVGGEGKNVWTKEYPSIRAKDEDEARQWAHKQAQELSGSAALVLGEVIVQVSSA